MEYLEPIGKKITRYAAQQVLEKGGTQALYVQDEPFVKTGLLLNKTRSIHGTEVEGYVALSAQPYENYRGETIEPPPPIIIRTAICRARMQKNIVRTAIQGRPGTVKEYISSGDYDIIIRGTVTSSESIFLQDRPDADVPVYERENKMPLEQMALISNWIEAETVVAIENEYLNGLGITDIIIEGCDFPQRRGTPNTLDFEIYAVSEMYQDLVIIEPGSGGLDLSI